MFRKNNPSIHSNKLINVIMLTIFKLIRFQFFSILVKKNLVLSLLIVFN
jgi:hypothetical protein